MDTSLWVEKAFDYLTANGNSPSAFDVYRIARLSFLKRSVLSDGETVLIYEVERSVKDLEVVQQFVETLVGKFKGKLVAATYKGLDYTDLVDEGEIEEQYDGARSTAIVWSNSCVVIEPRATGFLFYCASNNKEMFDKLVCSCLDISTTSVSAGNIGVLAQRSGGGLYVRDLGMAGVPFEESNYTSEVAQKYHSVVEQFNSGSPKGRLVLMEGPPGSGKTYLARSFLSDIKGTKFILVPSHLVERIGDPGMIDVLMEEKDYHTKRHITLVVEDADLCVSRRMGDNMSAISSMLNLCDGIIGSMLDVRVIATTNTRIERIDDALIRPGRMCEHITVDLLDKEQACAIYTRLTGKEASYTKGGISLAQIYADANVSAETPAFKFESNSPVRRRPPVGFV